MKDNKKTIGIIGGMGPEATVDLFKKIVENTPAKTDQEHIHVIIDNYPQIPARADFFSGTGPDPTPELVKSARMLERCGASALCMPCNNVHYFAQAVEDSVDIPLISIIDSALYELKDLYPGARNIGLLATRGTFKGRVYHRVFEKEDLNILSIPDEMQNEIQDIIFSVKAGMTQKAGSRFSEIVHRLEKMGTDVLITGCSELPLLLPFIDSTVPAIDPTLSLARKLVEFAFPGGCQDSLYSSTPPVR